MTWRNLLNRESGVWVLRAFAACVIPLTTAGCTTDRDARWDIRDPLTIRPVSATLPLGDTLRLTVTDGDPPSEYTWSARPVEIAEVDAKGRVVGNAPGTATITAERGSRKGWAIAHIVSSAHEVESPLLTRSDRSFQLDGRDITQFGLRAANVLQTDEILRRFIENMDNMLEHGIQSFSVTIQGGRHTHGGNSAFSGYNPDGTLKLEYALRLARLLEAAAAREMVPVVIFFYRGRDQELVGEDAVRNAVRYTMDFLRPWRHLWVHMINEPNHEGYDHRILRTPEGQVALYRLAKSIDPKRIVYVSHEPGANDGFLSDSWGRLPQVSPPANGDVMIEYARGWPGYYDSFKIPGVFPDGWAETAVRDSEAAFHAGGYWFLLACWHQKADAEGWPRFDKGGYGTAEDPGVAFIWDKMRALAFSSAKGDD